MVNKHTTFVVVNIALLIVLLVGIIGVNSHWVSADGPIEPEQVEKVDVMDGEREEKRREIEIAAHLIGIDTESLWEAVRTGQSIAEMAEANGIDPQLIIDALVADWSAQLEPRAAKYVNQTARVLADADKRDRVEPFKLPETVTELLDMDEEVVWTALKDGRSLADFAAANGIDPQTIVDTWVAETQAEIDEWVASGRLTAEEAAGMSTKIVERITKFVYNSDVR